MVRETSEGSPGASEETVDRSVAIIGERTEKVHVWAIPGEMTEPEAAAFVEGAIANQRARLKALNAPEGLVVRPVSEHMEARSGRE